MANNPDNISVSDILGPWVEPNWESGLIARCRDAWKKPLRTLSREELATLLRQGFAVAHLLPVAKRKLQEADDDAEMFDGELREAIEYASKAIYPPNAANSAIAQENFCGQPARSRWFGTLAHRPNEKVRILRLREQ